MVLSLFLVHTPYFFFLVLLYTVAYRTYVTGKNGRLQTRFESESGEH